MPSAKIGTLLINLLRSCSYFIAAKKNKLPKLRRCANRVGYGSKKFGPNKPTPVTNGHWPSLSPNWIFIFMLMIMSFFYCLPPCRPPCWPPCRPDYFPMVFWNNCQQCFTMGVNYMVQRSDGTNASLKWLPRRWPCLVWPLLSAIVSIWPSPLSPSSAMGKERLNLYLC